MSCSKIKWSWTTSIKKSFYWRSADTCFKMQMIYAGFLISFRSHSWRSITTHLQKASGTIMTRMCLTLKAVWLTCFSCDTVFDAWLWPWTLFLQLILCMCGFVLHLFEQDVHSSREWQVDSIPHRLSSLYPNCARGPLCHAAFLSGPVCQQPASEPLLHQRTGCSPNQQPPLPTERGRQRGRLCPALVRPPSPAAGLQQAGSVVWQWLFHQ